MRCFVVCSFAATIALAGAARAEGDAASLELPNPRLDPSPEVKPRAVAWYGYQTLLVDAVFIGVFASLPAWPTFDAKTSLVVLDAVAFAAATPLVHSLHGNSEDAVVSLGLHAGLPFTLMWVGLGIGLSMQTTCGSFGCNSPNVGPGAYVGTLVGAGIASILDAALFGWERRSPRPSSSAPWSIAPYALRRGAGLGVSATF